MRRFESNSVIELSSLMIGGSLECGHSIIDVSFHSARTIETFRH